MNEDFLQDELNEGLSFQKTLFFLGRFVHEGFRGKLNLLNYELVRKTLQSTPNNWQSLVVAIQESKAAKKDFATIIYLPTDSLIFCANPKYYDVWHRLLNELSGTNALIFIYEDNLDGNLDSVYEHRFSYYELELERFNIYVASSSFSEDLEQKGKKNVLQKIDDLKLEKIENTRSVSQLLEIISNSEVEVVPFRSRADVMIRTEEFLEDIDQGTFFRLYVPRGRYQDEQLASFLRLFENYLRTVEKKDFFIDVRKSGRGQAYIFRTKNIGGEILRIDEAISRFDDFMSICKNDQKKAEDILARTGLIPSEASYLIGKYSKEYQRI